MPKRRYPDDVAVRIELRWLTDRKVWAITGTNRLTVVSAEAHTRVPIDRTDVIRLVGAVRNELESWLPIGEDPVELEPTHLCENVGCQADTPWS